MWSHSIVKTLMKGSFGSRIMENDHFRPIHPPLSSHLHLRNIKWNTRFFSFFFLTIQTILNICGLERCLSHKVKHLLRKKTKYVLDNFPIRPDVTSILSLSPFYVESNFLCWLLSLKGWRWCLIWSPAHPSLSPQFQPLSWSRQSEEQQIVGGVVRGRRWTWPSCPRDVSHHSSALRLRWRTWSWGSVTKQTRKPTTSSTSFTVSFLQSVKEKHSDLFKAKS